MSDSLRLLAAAALREGRDGPSAEYTAGPTRIMTNFSFTVGPADAQLIRETRARTQRALDLTHYDIERSPKG